MLTQRDIVVIEKKMSVPEFKLLPAEEQDALLKKWHDEPILTGRDVPSLHNDGDCPMRKGRDY